MLQETISFVGNVPYLVRADGAGNTFSWQSITTGEVFTGATLPVAGSGLNSGSGGIGAGTVTNVATGAGLTGGPITTSGTLSIPAGGVTNAMLVNSSVTIAGHSVSLGGSQNLTATDVGLGNVTNDVQTKAAIVPNTAPAAGGLLVGNAGGTAYAPVSASGDVTVASTGVASLKATGTAGTYGSVTTDAQGRVTVGGADPAGNWWFGDGSDGTLTWDGTTTILGMVPSVNVYTLSRDVYAATMTVNNGVTIKTNSFRIFCSGTLTNNGTISFVGVVGGNAVAGTGASTGANNGNASGTLTGTFGAGQAGGTASGSSGGAGGNGSGASSSGNTGSGGAGGTGGTGNGGGAGGTAGATGVARVTYTRAASMQPTFNLAGSIAMMQGGVGGSGGSAGGNATGQTSGGGGGGAGGQGGGVMYIGAKVLANASGAITAAGGNGGNGANATANGGGGAAGGGGGGGWICLVYQSITVGTLSVAGGGPGTPGTNGGGTGAAGGAASSGTSGFLIRFNTTSGAYE